MACVLQVWISCGFYRKSANVRAVQRFARRKRLTAFNLIMWRFIKILFYEKGVQTHGRCALILTRARARKLKGFDGGFLSETDWYKIEREKKKKIYPCPSASCNHQSSILLRFGVMAKGDRRFVWTCGALPGPQLTAASERKLSFSETYCLLVWCVCVCVDGEASSEQRFI